METPTMQRKLSAILAADVVSYSRLMGADEVGTLNALKAVRRDVVDPIVASHHGRLVKTTGDGLLIEFASAVDAVGCAVAVQRAMLRRNSEIPEDKRLVFRIGVNVGDIIMDGDDIFGDGVNVAARLETLCEPGGVCISRSANDQVRDKLALSFADLGEKIVKNIARAVGVFGLAASDIAALPEPDEPMAPAPLPGPNPVRPESRRFNWRLAAAGIVLLLVAGSGAYWLTPRAAQAPLAVGTLSKNTAPDELFWNSIQGRNDPGELRAYLAAFPDGVFRDLARSRLDRLASAAPAKAAANPLPAAPAPAPPSPAQSAIEAALASMGVAGAKDISAAYAGMNSVSKALAAVPGTGNSWRAGFGASTLGMEELILEKCQIAYVVPCVLVAIGDQVASQPASGWERRDMPRVGYSGTFDPAQIPGIRPQIRENQNLKDYLAFKGPKAMVIHPENGYHYSIGKTDQRDAEDSALKNCRETVSRESVARFCFIYAQGDQVVLAKRLTASGQ